MLEEAGALFRGKIVIAETRPEYVNEDIMDDFISRIDDGSNSKPLYVAIGLETTNDNIREKSIDKGFSFDGFNQAVRAARNSGVGIKTYLLMKPLFLTEKEALVDMKQSLADLAGLCRYYLHEYLHRAAGNGYGTILETGGLSPALSLECRRCTCNRTNGGVVRSARGRTITGGT